MAPDMSSNTTTLTLALRAAPPKSVTLDPYFTLLYEDNKKALLHFLHHKAALPVQDMLGTPRFVEYLLSKEPGPKVQYANLRPALSAIRSFLVSSHGGKKLLAFYKHLLQVQGRWLMAAAEFVGFELYVKLTRALFITRDDKQLLAHFMKVIPNALSKLANCSNVDRASFEAQVNVEKTRLQEASVAAADSLFNFKVSKEFYYTHGKLLTAMEVHEKKLQELRERAVRRKAERQARIQAAYARNSATLSRQMGMTGMTPHNPQVEASVFQYTKRIRDEFFSFGEDTGAEEPLDLTDD
ncbi:uncharacterized protein Z520_07962 [Fonsecaea multimorphosa CBS 102226]|uniref:Uncharacterized protein n=1 Tax=Fonsecaea multimorphosa CBS 102226 TaxID=1442371 RepID=A0A0D2JZX5_9EURO|nr:uncharacterized protein Z520_07962 [Fonsecaea multimorphosa CBS 102226]KIX96184.1 hypothetical protein Z520_07962 [Fonsecaea multimorphosa CBS 102226]OAL22238.1 hypothetical protein AYO22_07282 [Fonsecaea multimorphosa]